MQKHDFQDRQPDGPKKPDPGARTTRWLLLAIAVLLGLIATNLLKRWI